MIRPFTSRFRIWLGMGVLCVALAAGITWSLWPRVTPRDQFRHGLAALERGELVTVLRISRGLRSQPGYASEAHLLQGAYLLKRDQPADALNELAQVVPQGELREPALAVSGESMYWLGRFADAERLFATLAAERPENAEAHRWLAAIAYDLGAMKRAIDELDVVSRLKPGDFRPHILKGHILFDMERFHAAAAEYSLVIAGDPGPQVLAEVLPQLARAQMRERDYEAALNTLSRAERTAGTLALQAECAGSLGRAAEAWKLLADAQALDPDQRDTLLLDGRMQLDAGRPEKAVRPLRRAVELDPHDHESRYQLAQALGKLGKRAEADAELERVNESSALKTKLAKLNQDAIDHPRDAAVREQIAELCEQMGKSKLAATWKRAAAACRQQETVGRGQRAVGSEQ